VSARNISGSAHGLDQRLSRKSWVTFILAFFFACTAPRICAQVDDHNPIGAMGTFEGVTTTGGAYNVLNHSATRAIDDIVVPGSIGKYPLRMRRYYVSRDFGDSRMGPGWRHEYAWSSGQGKIEYPNGNVWENYCQDPVGVSDWWEVAGTRFRLADGGTVVFDNSGRAIQIIDPYGQTTNITYATDAHASWMQVTEPGGRYLYFTYTQQQDGVYMLHEVDAYDGRGNRTDWVIYTYTSVQTGGNTIMTRMCLTRADYSDGTSATYTYEPDNVPEDPTHGSVRFSPPVSTCNDVRYHGAMRRIAYDYQGGGPHGAVTAERYSAGDGNKGLLVSSIPGNLPSPLSGADFQMPTDFTEARGDGPSRSFHYNSLHIHRIPGEPSACPDTSWPPSQFLQTYTDFQNHTTTLGYDQTTWYVTSVLDANNNRTSYQRGPNIGEITQIMHPDNTHIDYVYYNEYPNISGHYVQTVSNERQNVTTYTRDPTTHLVTRIDYPQDANTPPSFEVFSYNGFGQVLTHQLKNGAWESFVYDNRGLLTDKYNPKPTVPSGGDPHTHYTYYTSGPWTDRVMTMTLPANASGFQAFETYEYDRALGADGLTNPSGAAVAGRGLATKITHADNKYQSFRYDAYGNKGEEYNELGKRTSYTYDNYDRVLTVKNPLNNTTTYDYAPTQGDTTQCYLHTTNSPYWITTPTGIVTNNVYDQNFRKTSTAVAGLTTWFHYDPVGNQDYVTDPRGTGSGDANYTTYTDYDSRNRKWQVRQPLSHTTQFYYDDGINLTRIIRPDTTTETKTYDALNRVLTDTVPKTTNPVVNLTTWFTYNPSGTIWKVTDARGSGPGDPSYTITFAYDASDQKINMTYPDGSTQQWAYDNAHNLASRTTVKPVNPRETQSFSYDNRNRRTGMSWSNGVDSASFTYYDDGRLWTASNPNSTVTRQYDDAGRLMLENQSIPGVASVNVNYGYDNDGKQNRLWLDTGWNYDYTFSYDSAGRFEKIFVTGGAQLFQYYYDGASNERRRDNLSNGLFEFYDRDSLNRMQYMDMKIGVNTPLYHEGYGYNAMNWLTSTARWDGTDTFGYYLNGELNTAQYGATRNVTYTFDGAGNRTSVTDNVNGNASYTPNILNQYTAITGSSISNGNEHEISLLNKVSYSYINDEHLKQADDGTNIYGLAYDALGRCVTRTLTIRPATTNTNTIAYYIYDGEKPILEVWNGMLAKNLYGKGIDEILMRTDTSVNGGAAFYYQHDHEGSVTHLTNGSGTIIEKYRYDAFGTPTFYNGSGTQIPSTAYNNRFLFTGREYSATFQGNYFPFFTFYEYRARAYNPQLGRFMSEDPKLFDAGDYNLFRYCHNDPIDFTDPMGLEDHREPWPNHQEQAKALDEAYNFIMGLMQREFNSAIGAGLAGYSAYQAWSGLQNALASLTTAQGPAGQVTNRSASSPKLNPTFLREAPKAVDDAGIYADHHAAPTGFNIYERPDGSVFRLQADRTDYLGPPNQWREHYPPNPPNATLLGNAHWHMRDLRNPHAGSTFSRDDASAGRYHPVMHNGAQRGSYDIFFQGWRWLLNGGGLSAATPYYGN
jgi:RHS repeat-associated protein